MRARMDLRALALAIALMLTLFSCRPVLSGSGNIAPSDAVTDRFTPAEDKIAVFENGAPWGFWARNDRGNGHPFNCSFDGSNAIIDNGVLELLLDGSEGAYRGAEYRSFTRYSYGYYSVSMKAASCPGVISSFFTYTGRPWDEIDIEFLGDNTTVVQFNYYTDGKGGHEYFYELGFDASEDYHEYGFDWQPDSITWYVDGKSVYRATVDIPSHESQIMMNIWNVADSNADWAGRFVGDALPVSAYYEWIGYKSAN